MFVQFRHGIHCIIFGRINDITKTVEIYLIVIHSNGYPSKLVTKAINQTPDLIQQKYGK